MITLEGLRIDGEIRFEPDGRVSRADPMVLVGLDLLVELDRRNRLVVEANRDLRFAGQVTYRPIGWAHGCLVCQRVEDDWAPGPAPDVPPRVSEGAERVVPAGVVLPPGPCPHPPHLPCPACNMPPAPGWRRT